MDCSLLEISRRMDPAVPLTSMRELARRHRWIGGGPPDPISLRAICARHHQPQTTMHRVLWYNTYLIHGLQLSLCNTIEIGRILPSLPAYFTGKLLALIAPQELVDAFDIATETLAKAFGITKSMLVDKFPDVIDSFVETVADSIPGLGWVVKTVKKSVSDITFGDILGKLSTHDLIDKFGDELGMTPDQIVAKLGLDIGKVAAAFCDRFIGLLSDETGVPLDKTIDISGAAPDRPMRAAAIGQMLANEYDVAGLCEVWEPDRQADVISAAAASGRKTAASVGPQADGELGGSGLLTVVFDGRVARHGGGFFDDLLHQPGVLIFGEGGEGVMHVFTNQGNRLKDADAWSRKGVLLTVLDVGVGNVDLYTTHLYKGGDIGVLGDPTDDEIWAVKKSQIEEIVSFIRDTHRPAHVAILMGDFNIGATERAQYTHLRNRLATRHLVDLWPFWREPPAHGRVIKPHGSTDDPATVCIGKDQPFCSEPNVPLDNHQQPVGKRIDYVFIERPRSQHGFTLDVTRIRRRAFQFTQSEIGFLSDHVGLDLMLIASP